MRITHCRHIHRLRGVSRSGAILHARHVVLDTCLQPTCCDAPCVQHAAAAQRPARPLLTRRAVASAVRRELQSDPLQQLQKHGALACRSSKRPRTTLRHQTSASAHKQTLQMRSKARTPRPARRRRRPSPRAAARRCTAAATSAAARWTSTNGTAAMWRSGWASSAGAGRSCRRTRRACARSALWALCCTASTTTTCAPTSRCGQRRSARARVNPHKGRRASLAPSTLLAAAAVASKGLHELSSLCPTCFVCERTRTEA